MVRVIRNGEVWQRRGNTWHMIGDQARVWDGQFAPISNEHFEGYARSVRPLPFPADSLYREVPGW